MIRTPPNFRAQGLDLFPKLGVLALKLAGESGYAVEFVVYAARRGIYFGVYSWRVAHGQFLTSRASSPQSAQGMG